MVDSIQQKNPIVHDTGVFITLEMANLHEYSHLDDMRIQKKKRSVGPTAEIVRIVWQYALYIGPLPSNHTNLSGIVILSHFSFKCVFEGQDLVVSPMAVSVCSEQTLAVNDVSGPVVCVTLYCSSIQHWLNLSL